MRENHPPFALALAAIGLLPPQDQARRGQISPCAFGPQGTLDSAGHPRLRRAPTTPQGTNDSAGHQRLRSHQSAIAKPLSAPWGEIGVSTRKFQSPVPASAGVPPSLLQTPIPRSEHTTPLSTEQPATSRPPRRRPPGAPAPGARAPSPPCSGESAIAEDISAPLRNGRSRPEDCGVETVLANSGQVWGGWRAQIDFCRGAITQVQK